MVHGTKTFAVTQTINSLAFATVGGPITATFRVEAKVKAISFQPPAVGWSFVGLFGDFVDNMNYDGVIWWHDGRVASTNRENGSGSDASNPQSVLVLGQWYTFRLEREGTTMRAHFDDKALTGSIGTKAPTGRIAIGA